MSTPHVVRFERGLRRIAGRCWCSVHLSCSSPAHLFHATDWSPQQFHADGQARPSMDPVRAVYNGLFLVNTASGLEAGHARGRFRMRCGEILKAIFGPRCRVPPPLNVVYRMSCLCLVYVFFKNFPGPPVSRGQRPPQIPTGVAPSPMHVHASMCPHPAASNHTA